jgi:transcriptional regulator with XRE-family HTH domain
MKAGTGSKVRPKSNRPRAPQHAKAAENPISKTRHDLGLTRKMFARLAGFSERAIAGWESGQRVSEPGLRRVKELERLRGRLAEIVREEGIPQWLDTPNQAFGGLKPLEVIERGEIDRLWKMIFYMESGVPS